MVLRDWVLFNVPFEFVCEVACARAMAEASDIEGGASTARHGCDSWRLEEWGWWMRRGWLSNAREVEMKPAMGAL
jgi:hypothetical protein